jgi:16S rRNA (adenine1518-N6/adenine1519-N6)-dimethyltransferase
MPVLEIGAGPGYLTDRLAEAGLRVTAVETDPYCVKLLTAAPKANVTVLHADILKLDLPEAGRRHLKTGEKWRVVGNLPFAISSPILGRLLSCRALFDVMVLMFQKEVVERLTAEPGTKSYGVMTLETAYYCRRERAFPVSRKLFKPVPAVDGQMLKLTVRDAPPVKVSDEQAFFGFIKKSFAERRKTLANNLSSAYPDIPRERVQEALKRMGLPPAARAEILSLDQFAALFRELEIARG